MKVVSTALDGVLIIEPRVFEDSRGFFMETFHRKRYAEQGIRVEFCQDNLSASSRGTLRGMHYQVRHAQAKLVQVLQGEVYDVVVDIRRGSPTLGRWVGLTLSQRNRHQVFIPRGLAHGFCVISQTATFVYKCSDFYSPEDEAGVLWNDPDLGIDWPVSAPILSEKDARLPRLRDIPEERLPVYD
jgi:dTDP-4-dehydrorhamnose 3,5-epimerase